MRIIIILTIVLTTSSCQTNKSVSKVEPGTILGKWEYVSSATEARNMGIPVITPWPINGLTFNEDGTLEVDTRKDGILKGTWLLDQSSERYIMKSPAMFLNKTFIKVSDLLNKKMILSYQNNMTFRETEKDQVNDVIQKQEANPTYLYKRSKQE